MSATLDLKNLKKFAQELVRKPFRGIEEQVFKILLGTHTYYFEAAISPSRRKWAPLAESTIQRKGHDTILVDSGKLRASLTQRSGGIRRVDRPDDTKIFVHFGSRVSYLIYHQTGTARMPARPALGLPPSAADLILEATANHIMEQLR